jgi:hypothetical protein
MLPLPFALPALSGGFRWALLGILAAVLAGAAWWGIHRWEQGIRQAVVADYERAADQRRIEVIGIIHRLKEDQHAIANQWSAAAAAVAQRYGRDVDRLRADARRLRDDADRLRRDLPNPAGTAGVADGAAGDRELPRCVAPDRRPDLEAILANAELDAERLARCQDTLRSWRERVNGG